LASQSYSSCTSPFAVSFFDDNAALDEQLLNDKPNIKVGVLAVRTTKAMFSKSQNSAKLRSPFVAAGSCVAGAGPFLFGACGVLNGMPARDLRITSTPQWIMAPEDCHLQHQCRQSVPSFTSGGTTFVS
jgi:hypothetical protein